jgi:hypothetical protein
MNDSKSNKLVKIAFLSIIASFFTFSVKSEDSVKYTKGLVEPWSSDTLIPTPILRGVLVTFLGLPNDGSKSVIQNKVINIQDGSVVSSLKTKPDAGSNFELPDKHLLVSANYRNSVLGVDYFGFAGTTSQNNLVIPMKQANENAVPQKKYTTYPPASGKAIGFNNDGFKVTGSEASKLSPRGISEMITTDLGMNSCAKKENSYVVVVSADPIYMEKIDMELEVQKSPDFDPRYKVNQRLIGPTHMVSGNIILNPGDYSMTFTITDLKGNVTASSSSRGSDFWETYESASAGLINQLCNPTVEFLDGMISVTIENSKFSPNKKDQIQSESVSTSISGKITVRIIRDRIQRYIDNPDSRRECDPTMHCPILSGGSDFQARDALDYSTVLFANRYPLIVKIIKNEMGIRGIDGKEKYVNTYNSAADDTNSVEGLNLEIKAYVAGEGQLAPLSPYYVIWLTGGKYLDKFRIQPFGRGGAMQWDIYKEKLVPISDPVGVGIPYVIAEPEADMSLYKTYEPLLIKNSADFERYLMNPYGSFKIYASGKQAQENENFTSEGQVTVTISLSPHEILNQPKN